MHKPKPELAPAPTLGARPNGWIAPVARASNLVEARVFNHLGLRGDLDELGWDAPHVEKLWRYNQHYFDDLNAQDANLRSDWHHALIHDWIVSNPAGAGTAWDPYPTSLRICNWVKWMWAGNALPDAAVTSLAVQARWLMKRLEWHLLGNHLFANAKALVFAGLAFRGREADLWLASGLRIIADELPEQILRDGGNFERSPMYHAIFLEDMADLVNATRACAGRVSLTSFSDWEAVVARMVDWLRGMTHPDGGISLFNDAALNIAPRLCQLDDYVCRLGIAGAAAPVGPADSPHRRVWQDSGYVRLAAKDAVAFLDVGPIGPDYLPGHAHADTLSFELSLFQQRCVVNGGTSRYGLGPERLRERETASHSTVEVDGENSSEVWGGFRVARRAFPFDFAETVGPDLVSVACSHDGYMRLTGKPVHRRTWTMRSAELQVDDVVTGKYGRAVARYLLHPAVQIQGLTPNKWLITLPSGHVASFEVIAGAGSVEQAQYAPEFGTVQITSCIVVELHNGAARISIKWS